MASSHGSKLSVIIPVYNRRAYLRRAVESILQEGLPNIEIIIVDDGSTDDSCATVADLPVRFLHFHSNRGPAAARNAGIAGSSGSYITFLDSDDILLPRGIRSRVEFLDERQMELLVAGIVTEAIDEQGRVLGPYRTVFAHTSDEHLIPDRLTREFFQRGYRFASPLGASMYVMRRELFERVGLYDETLRNAYDWDFVFRTLALTEIPVISVPIFQYRVHAANSSFTVEKDGLRARRRQIVEGLLVHWQNGLLKDHLP